MGIFVLGYLRIILQMKNLYYGNFRLCITMRFSALVCINVYNAEFY